MPANLPPQYIEAEKRYREAKTTSEKIQALKQMYALIPKHKGTEKLQADIKKRIARHKEELKEKGKKGKKGFSLHVEKEGAAQVVLVGAPNVGKSQLLSAFTNAVPEVAEYPYTTRAPYPGMMPYENIQIQLVDLPPISAEYLEPWVTSIIRNSDAVLLVVDLGSDEPLEQLDSTLSILQEVKIKLMKNAPEIDPWNPVACKETFVVGNKLDVPTATEKWQILKSLYSDAFPMLAISAKRGDNLEELKSRIFEMLNILRIYSKRPGKKADLARPFILKKGSTLLDFAKAIHKDFAAKLKYARVWGAEKFDGQRINKDYLLMDGDVIELHI